MNFHSDVQEKKLLTSAGADTDADTVVTAIALPVLKKKIQAKKGIFVCK